MISRRKFLKVGGSALLGASAMGLAACGRPGGGGDNQSDGGPFTIKFSHVNTPETPKGLAAEKFKEILEQKTDGEITVEIYPNSTLHGDKEELQSLQSNSIQMIATATSKLGTVDPRLEAFDLPFNFSSFEEVAQIVSRDKDNAVSRLIFDNSEFAQRNMIGLGMWDNGIKQFHSNTPIQAPDDTRGLKLRIPPSEVIARYMGVWGAQPSPMALSEVYSALQQGVIDGGENFWTNMTTLRFYEVQSHATASRHGYVGNVLVTNEEFLGGLPDDLREAVLETADDATAYNRKVAGQAEDEAKNEILEAGDTEIIELSEAERQAFKDMVVPKVWDEFAEVFGEDVVNDLKSVQA